MKNNPFEQHNFTYLSASRINQYVADVPMFVLKYLFNISDQTNPSALRGHVVEYGLNRVFLEKSVNDVLLNAEFDKKLVEENIFDEHDEKQKTERQVVADCFAMAKDNCKYEQLLKYQDKIEVHFEDLPIHFIGYIDFVFNDCIVDLKTTTRMPSELPTNVKRQMALYNMAYPDKQIFVDYVTPKKHKRFDMSLEEVSFYQQEIYKISMNIQNLLGMSDNPYELASMFYPNYDNWMWSNNMKNEAKKIWRI